MYAKLFASIYQGTLRGNTHGLVVFTNLLAHADEEGWVDIHPKSIAEEVGLTLTEVQAALDCLEAPDIDSRSPEEEGRRIVRLNDHRSWGWRIVNHGKYRAIKNQADRREQNRIAQEKYRNKIKANNKIVSNSKQAVSNDKQSSAESAHTDTDTEADTKPLNGKFHLPEWVDKSTWDLWILTRKGKKMIQAQMEAQVKKLEKWKLSGLDWEKSLSDAAAAGYMGLVEPKPFSKSKTEDWIDK